MLIFPVVIESRNGAVKIEQVFQPFWNERVLFFFEFEFNFGSAIFCAGILFENYWNDPFQE